MSDYLELLVAPAFGLELAPKSVPGYDATAPDGTRYQVKGRRPTPANPSRQLSFIRGLGSRDIDPFDYLVGALLGCCGSGRRREWDHPNDDPA